MQKFFSWPLRAIWMCAALLLAGCVTTAKEGTGTVTEYKSVVEMESFATCKAIGPVSMSYDVFMHAPWERKRAAHIRIKEAASVKGGNAVVMISNTWGVITDSVDGVAYQCSYRDRA